MKFIQKITTYNVPIKKSSQDRYLDDIDNKILPYKVEEIPEDNFSYSLSNSTNAVFTFNSTKRTNYIRIESSLFKGKTVSYWFLVDVSEIESEVGTRYSAFLDVTATFGNEMFGQLENKKIEIERYHGDRYVPDATNTKLTINTKHHSLLNSDFKIGDTKGQELRAVGYSRESSKSHKLMHMVVDARDSHNVKITYEDLSNAGELSETTFSDINCQIDDGRPILGMSGFEYKKQHYVYAILSGPSLRKYLRGSNNANSIPSINGPMEGVYRLIKAHVNDPLETNYIDKLFNADNHRDYGDVYVVPVLQKSSATALNVTQGNSMEWLQSLPEGVVISINALPEPIEYDDNKYEFSGSQKFKGISITTYYNDSGQDYGLLNVTVLPFPILKKQDVVPMSHSEILAKLDVLKEITALPADEDKLHVGLLNQDITNIKLELDGEEVDVDMYNFLNSSKEELSVEQTVGTNGGVLGVNISDNQYHMFNFINDFTFFTSQAATYMQQNRNSITTQRKRVDLETDMQIKQNKVNRRSQWSGSPVGALFSMVNPMSWNVESTLSEMPDVIRNIGANKKQEIDAHIQDLQSTPSSINMAKENTLHIFNFKKGDGFEKTYVMKFNKPNEVLLSKIKMFYKRFGTLANGVYTFTKNAMLTNMEKFNFIKVNAIKDYLTTSDALDIDIIEEFDKELKAGIRIHHSSAVDYNSRNIEKNILQKFP